MSKRKHENRLRSVENLSASLCRSCFLVHPLHILLALFTEQRLINMNEQASCILLAGSAVA